MSQSRQKPCRSKGKDKADSFVWTDDEAGLLLKVTTECLVSETSEKSMGNHAKQSTPIFWIFLWHSILRYFEFRFVFRVDFSRVRLDPTP